MFRIMFILVYLITALGSASMVLSDDLVADFQSAQITEAHLLLDEDANSGVLSFRITNNSSGNLTILGVTDTGHMQSKIIVRLDDTNYAELGSITLLREENLDLTTTHIFIQLSNITEPIKADQKIDLKLVFTNGEMPISAHVAPSKQ
ncbi:hypothetical protein [Candidatus Nitrotoga sp. M5]|uniref:hypothetical protein n=1 Tax=Candidatus Nitrotoga sp. M5 TaxID=2890409 RepID=UPI001EF6D3AC|nr:hypothetical protein [Candidatus Nitrotoga sp. M5]CAH1387966.1 conserved hypothetical protein [Candidatus Nitrotoga sp. M5]